MVLLTITPAIASALEHLDASSRSELSLPAPHVHSSISHTQLIALSRRLRSLPSQATAEVNSSNKPSGTGLPTNNGSFRLESLLRGTKPYIPPQPPKPEPTPEYLALKAKLLAAAEASKYNSLLHPPSSSRHGPSPIFSSSLSASPFADTPHHTSPYSLSNGDPSSRESYDDDPISPSLVINILVSIIFTGFSVYWATSHFRIPDFLTFSSSERPSYPGSISSQPARVFISLFFGLLVGVAEVVVYAAYLRKVSVAKKREGRIVERKEVIGEVGGRFDGQDGSDAVVVGKKEREEIWGRGVNGGARRRVKERWREGKDEER
ncbi:hypothetical protein AJ80_04434 [Polytolypa hystricis UAMH7299]|uniref:Uncharacterized protein n=1 Tax=Polytolypa hystricis (strain UAMH7299) TaxID=1447883 RepID=A0A2B7YAX2_POLH7|nr:hypothetical protein AJ80_04434 [Polytolypa hystricis UAMH7299]